MSQVAVGFGGHRKALVGHGINVTAIHNHMLNESPRFFFLHFRGFIQLAKAFGARVYTTVGNAEKVEAVKKIGAELAINYKEQDWAEEISRLTGGQGVNCILDMVGGPYIQKNLRSLALEGRLIQVAFQQGAKTELDCMSILIKRLTFSGSTLRPRSVDEKAAIALALLNNVWPLLEAGKVRPIIHATFPIAEAVKAHELMETSNHIGKIMLKVRSE